MSGSLGYYKFVKINYPRAAQGRLKTCRGRYWLQVNRWDWVESRQVKVCGSRLWSPRVCWVRIRCGLVTVSQSLRVHWGWLGGFTCHHSMIRQERGGRG